MYVKDVARVALLVMEKFSGAINMGSNQILRIRDVVEMIAEIADMKGQVIWDAEKPNGQDYRAYDLSKLNGLGFVPSYSIREGLGELWSWYNENSREIK
jgi:GDP-L-fucose synthase